MIKSEKPELRFSPAAWSKMIYFRELSKTNEVSAFGICHDADELLRVDDVVLVKQSVGAATTDFDDDAVATFFYEMDKAGFQPFQVGRIWIHTHPSFSPSPSGKDEDTFREAFGNCSWACMVILGGDKNFCRLRIGGMGLPELIVEPELVVDWGCAYTGTNYKLWKQEFDDKVDKNPIISTYKANWDTWKAGKAWNATTKIWEWPDTKKGNKAKAKAKAEAIHVTEDLTGNIENWRLDTGFMDYMRTDQGYTVGDLAEMDDDTANYFMGEYLQDYNHEGYYREY